MTNRVQIATQRLRLRAARARFARAQPHLAAVIRQVRDERLTYVSGDSLRELAEAVLESSHLQGAIVEAGTALGGSGIVLAAAKEPDRQMKLYDVFGMITKPHIRRIA